MSLSKSLYPLLSTGPTQEMFQHYNSNKQMQVFDVLFISDLDILFSALGMQTKALGQIFI